MTLRDRLLDLETRGVELWRSGEKLGYRAPRGAMDDGLRGFLATNKQAIFALLDLDLDGDPAPSANPQTSFPMTPLQEAYLLGRTQGLFLGGVGCHAYGELDLPRSGRGVIAQAWARLVARHPMLRAMPGRDGTMRIRPDDGPALTVREIDARDLDAALDKVRAGLSHRLYAPDEPRFWSLEVLHSGDRTRLCLSIDFVIADFESIATLLADLENLLAAQPLPPLPRAGIADHVQTLLRRRDGLGWARDRAWWMSRRGEIAARLWRPAAAESQALREAPPRFRRLSRVVPEAALPARDGIGVAALAAYAEALGGLVSGDGWLVNVTASGRPPAAPGTRAVFGNLSTTALLPVSRRDAAEDYSAWSHRLHDELLNAIGHLGFGGVELLRSLRQPGTGPALAPFVFTNMLSMTSGAGALAPVYSLSQTPQVLVDCQIGRAQGGLEVSWDIRDGFRSAADLQGAFDGFVARLCRRSAGQEAAPVTAMERYRAALLALPGVETVHVECPTEPGPIALATRVPAQPATDRSGAADRMLEQARNLTFIESPYGRVLQTLDGFALAEIFDLMRRRGVDLATPLTPETVSEALRASPPLRPLVGRWLDALVEAGLATRMQEGSTILSPNLPQPPAPADWHALREMADGDEPRAILDYFRLCGLSLGEIVTGAADPARLFFPNGAFDIASALFGESRMNRELHAAAGALAVALADARKAPLRVLELGSGTGATAAAMLAALGERAVRWTATDISPAMLDHLRRRFGNDPRVDVRRLDMDGHPAWYEIWPCSVDLVVAGDALHLASDPDRALRDLHDRIAPGGALLMIEMCMQRPQMMIALETIYAAQGRGVSSPFRNAEAWRASLAAAGFGAPETVQHRDSGQAIFVAKACGTRTAPECDAIAGLAWRHLGIPAGEHAIFLEPEPVRFPDPPAQAVDMDTVPRSSWRFAAVLGLLPEEARALAGPGSTMLSLGMDSLLAAQFTGRLIEAFPAPDLYFDDILALLLDGASLAAIERYVAGARPGKEDSKAGADPAVPAVPDLLIFGDPDPEMARLLERKGRAALSGEGTVRIVLGIGAGSADAAHAAMELSETGSQAMLVLDAPEEPPDTVFLTIDICLLSTVEDDRMAELWRSVTLGRVTQQDRGTVLGTSGVAGAES